VFKHLGIDATVMAWHMGDLAQVRHLISEVDKKFGGVNFIVKNAAISMFCFLLNRCGMLIGSLRIKDLLICVSNFLFRKTLKGFFSLILRISGFIQLRNLMLGKLIYFEELYNANINKLANSI
jgi:hypothetical protein